MSILKLYGARLSSNTRRVATVLIEKKVLVINDHSGMDINNNLK
jgi:hypothetical protein